MNTKTSYIGIKLAIHYMNTTPKSTFRKAWYHRTNNIRIFLKQKEIQKVIAHLFAAINLMNNNCDMR